MAVSQEVRDAWELAGFVVTALGLPFAIAFFAWEQRKERDNGEGARLPGGLQPDRSETEARRWNSRDDSMREWCHRDDFHNALPLLLRGEDPQFQSYLRRIAEEERGALPTPSA